jgi:hypothetical protein
MNVLFNELALLEFSNAIEFYELEQAGLGKQFEEEIKRSLRRIIRYPSAWSIEQGEMPKLSPWGDELEDHPCSKCGEKRQGK